MKTLILSGNQLKAIPNSIGNLEMLEKILLGCNCLDSLPPEIGDLRSLKELNGNYINI